MLPVQRILEPQRERGYLGIVPVWVVPVPPMLMPCVLMPGIVMPFRRQPRLDLVRPHRRVVHVDAPQNAGRGRHDMRRGRVQAPQPVVQPGLRRPQVGLRQHDHIRDRHLLHAFQVPVQRAHALQRIHHRDDPAEAEPPRDREGDQRLDDRRRVRQPRRLDQHAVEPPHLSPDALLQQVPQRLHQVAPHRAAQAARAQLDRVVVAGGDQRVVDPDLAELVDDHGSVRQVRVAQPGVQHGRLAAAQETRQQADRNALRGHSARNPGS